MAATARAHSTRSAGVRRLLTEAAEMEADDSLEYHAEPLEVSRSAAPTQAVGIRGRSRSNADSALLRLAIDRMISSLGTGPSGAQSVLTLRVCDPSRLRSAAIQLAELILILIPRRWHLPRSSGPAPFVPFRPARGVRRNALRQVRDQHKNLPQHLVVSPRELAAQLGREDRPAGPGGVLRHRGEQDCLATSRTESRFAPVVPPDIKC